MQPKPREKAFRNSKRTEEIKIKRLDLGRTQKSNIKALTEKASLEWLGTYYKTKRGREETQIQHRAFFFFFSTQKL